MMNEMRMMNAMKMNEMTRARMKVNVPMQIMTDSETVMPLPMMLMMIVMGKIPVRK